jgi:hypothetical protein
MVQSYYHTVPVADGDTVTVKVVGSLVRPAPFPLKNDRRERSDAGM